ncbi:unnamed protein product [Linum trigynum]|uniref:Uncharacterized protein n=1 Tax=Linum trigynum TaxID=586398 RepID=A0AAV2EP74_9ROSI
MSKFIFKVANPPYPLFCHTGHEELGRSASKAKFKGRARKRIQDNKLGASNISSRRMFTITVGIVHLSFSFRRPVFTANPKPDTHLIDSYLKKKGNER